MVDTQQVTVKVKTLRAGARLPSYGSVQSAGSDLSASLDEALVIESGAWALVPTGLAMSIPAGYEGQVRARSGLALKHGISVLNGVGTIDSDYRGEVGVLLINHGPKPFVINDGDRIAQLVISRYSHAHYEAVLQLDDSSRGSGGFGSTGV